MVRILDGGIASVVSSKSSSVVRLLLIIIFLTGAGCPLGNLKKRQGCKSAIKPSNSSSTLPNFLTCCDSCESSTVFLSVDVSEMLYRLPHFWSQLLLFIQAINIK